MNVLHLLVSGGTGGIEVLMKNYAQTSTHRNIFVFVWKSGEIAEIMIKNGTPVYALEAAKDGALETLKKIYRICTEERVDVVVSHNSAPLLKLALLYMKIRNPKIRAVAYAHANARDICEHKRKKGLTIRKAVHRMGFAIADGIVAISDSVKESLQTYLKVDGEKIRRIYNGTRVSTDVDVCPEKSRQDELRLIYVGRLIPEKGVQNTLRMLAEVKRELPYAFTIVGDGPCRKELERYAETLGIADRVRFLGQREDVAELLATSDVFIHLPDWEEGFGITVIEALAEGCICIVNDRGALPEIVENGKDGYVVSAGAVDATVELLKDLRGMPEASWRQLQVSARQKAQKFSMDHFVKKLDDFLWDIALAAEQE